MKVEEDKADAVESTPKTSLPDAHDEPSSSPSLDKFLAGIDEFAEEKKTSAAAKASATTSAASSSPMKRPGTSSNVKKNQPGMQSWQKVAFTESKEARTEYIKTLLHKFTSIEV